MAVTFRVLVLVDPVLYLLDMQLTHPDKLTKLLAGDGGSLGTVAAAWEASPIRLKENLTSAVLQMTAKARWTHKVRGRRQRGGAAISFLFRLFTLILNIELPI